MPVEEGYILEAILYKIRKDTAREKVCVGIRLIKYF